MARTVRWQPGFRVNPERSRKLLSRFQRPIKVKKIVFQDEKDFTLQLCANRQNNRVYSQERKSEIEPKRLFHRQSKQRVKLMVSACISCNGVTRPFFIDPAKGKVNAKYYTNHLRRQILPACRRLYPEGNYVFMQDGASSHTPNLRQGFLKKELGYGKYITKTQWPPNSPDCNPIDYYFWSKVEEYVYRGRSDPFPNVEELKSAITLACRDVQDLHEIPAAILQFLPRVREVVKQNGGPMQHIFG